MRRSRTGARRALSALALAGVAAVAAPAVAAGAHRRDPVGGSQSIALPAGASTRRLQFDEPAGTVRLFRIVAGAGTRLKVSGVLRGLAGVSAAIPARRDDPAETCHRQGRSVSCIQGEEACPLPPATWLFRVRKAAGPAGRIRIVFVVDRGQS